MHVHGDNLSQKESHKTKYIGKEARNYLVEIRNRYDVWCNKNEDLHGPLATPMKNDQEILEQRVKLFSGYKDFLDQEKYAVTFDSRSNLHSTVLEEFMYYLFRDMVQSVSESALIGKAHTFKDIFFMPPNFSSMLKHPHAHIEIKDHDFVIGVVSDAKLQVQGSDKVQDVSLQIPAIAIECKTYLDKTMLEGSSSAAEQLKLRNPNALYIVVAEWLKLTESINVRKYKVDQVYVLRKQKNTDREFRYNPSYKKNPIYADVVSHLFNLVRSYLTADWESGVHFGLDKGFLL